MQKKKIKTRKRATKNQLVDALIPVFTEMLAEPVSRDKAWKLYRSCLLESARLASTADGLNLIGIGNFKRSRQPDRLEFSSSDRFLEELEREDEVELGIRDLFSMRVVSRKK